MNGINIYSAEIERVMSTHPLVQEVMAFPFEHSMAQDLPVCAVVLSQGSAASSDELQDFAFVRLGIKAPRVVVIVPSIPRNEEGKPVRAKLLALVRNSLDQRSRQAEKKPAFLHENRQRRRLIAITFTPPTMPRADLLKPWRILLTDDTDSDARNIKTHTPADNDGILAWLGEVLLIAHRLLHEARIPVFVPPKVLQTKRLKAPSSADRETWHAVLEVPVLDHLESPTLEPVLTRAFQAAMRIAAKAHKNYEGPILDPVKIENFLEKIQTDELASLLKLAPAYGKSTFNVLSACYAQGVPWSDLGGGIYQLGWGSRSRRIDRSTTDGDSAMGMQIVRDKYRTARLLRAAGLPAAEHQFVRTAKEALDAGVHLGWPVVIKPADADRGEGVRVDLQPHEIEAAFAVALERSPTRRVLLERQVDGVCHRLFVAQNQLLYAVRRLPIGIFGNGADSVETLVNAAYSLERKRAPWRRSPIRPIDDLALTELSRQGVLTSSVPAQNCFVSLRRIESSEWGGVDEDVTALIHPDNLRIALEACHLCGLEVAGVDLISPDISQPWHSNGAIINEINYAPLLGESAISRKHLHEYISRLLGGDGRIAVEVFVGDEAAANAGRQRATQLNQQGIAAVVTSHDWTCWGDGREIVIKMDSLYARTRAVILWSSVDALILVIQNDDLSYGGLPLEGVDSVEVVNHDLTSREHGDGSARQSILIRRLVSWAWVRRLSSVSFEKTKNF